MEEHFNQVHGGKIQKFNEFQNMENIAQLKTRYKCFQCSKSYVQKAAMEEHFQQVHGGKIPMEFNTPNNRATVTANILRKNYQGALKKVEHLKKITVVDLVDLDTDEIIKTSISRENSNDSDRVEVNQNYPETPKQKTTDNVKSSPDLECILPD